ncbi:cob(I)yrinic acid a,c-diamide adenosyltransferase [Sedimentibacter sp. zth1]|uniref:cob(I)yrinic acid a,c-diamide adenosyltransferase n=1 Tax=Sedimentibacter sp. zth1 TaxID=2816908 RepID=UPI001A9143E3|nr:cob(I)yrinic acid a,c-diamide adenosyltransferase [Sedimentibacter sp. zth1]QSX06629.1 cob(I)yrinic acid a,c-diamide adenosyltransferase [Sedimentibacter sp. zth1]
MDKGYIHIYTGNGKGKTTAAFGLALRTMMAGKSVYIGQFVKDMKYNETKIEKYFENIKIEQLGHGCFINTLPKQEDIDIATEGLNKCAKILKSGDYDLVILDELNIALYFKLFDVKKVIEILNNRAENVEVVITGRYAPKELIDIADLVTEMKEIKHYYYSGVEARDGIER